MKERLIRGYGVVTRLRLAHALHSSVSPCIAIWEASRFRRASLHVFNLPSDPLRGARAAIHPGPDG